MRDIWTGKHLHDLMKLGLSKMFDEWFDEHRALALPNEWRGRSNYGFSLRTFRCQY